MKERNQICLKRFGEMLRRMDDAEYNTTVQYMLIRSHANQVWRETLIDEELLISHGIEYEDDHEYEICTLSEEACAYLAFCNL
ncbi:MAG: hypothetical protein KJO69_07820 [Gammaproteobacteria bacterium]|nr:hypothetical protein [Gammaproteobacteria bacterium]